MKTNAEILEELNSRVYGHESVKKTLINIINRSKIRYLQIYKNLISPEKCIPKQNCLLVGASGTGKTMIVTELSKIMKFPYKMFDLSKLNSIGCSGGGVTGATILDSIRAYANAVFKNAQITNNTDYFSPEGVLAQMVVFLDEIDKTAIDAYVGDWRYKVQSEMLSVFEGSNDLANLTIIAAGAFKSLTMQKNTNSSIGFHRKTNSSEVFDIKREDKNNTIDDLDNELLKIGICPELLGRIGTICQLDIFTKRDYEKVFEERLYPKFLIDLELIGISDFRMENKQKEQLIKDSMDSGTGIRGIYRHLNKISSELEFNADTLVNFRGKYNHGYRAEETYDNTNQTQESSS